MRLNDQPRFFQALLEMGEFFSDELSEVRQSVYLELFESISIEAWEYACRQCMRHETFHKVPLPGVITRYVKEYQRRERDMQDALAADQYRYRLEATYIAERERLAADAEEHRVQEIAALNKEWDADDAN